MSRPWQGSSLNPSLRSASCDQSIAASLCQSPLSTQIACVREFARCGQVWRKAESLIGGRFANANLDARRASSEGLARQSFSDEARATDRRPDPDRQRVVRRQRRP